jgi:hypothetical protein
VCDRATAPAGGSTTARTWDKIFFMSGAVTLQRIRDSERELQRVFDAWPFQAGPVQTLQADSHNYVLVGCPSWLNARRKSSLPKTLTSSLGYDFRPDLVWEGDGGSFVIELKSSVKYEPIALPEALHHAWMLEEGPLAKKASVRRPVVPVMVTQYNVWLRASLEFLFARGLGRDALHYLEFDALSVPSSSNEAESRILWFDEPFAPWVRVDPSREIARLARDFKAALLHEPRHWYWIEATSTWVTTECEQANDQRPLFIDGPYSMIVHAGGDSFVLWTGSQVDTGIYHRCTLRGAGDARSVASPRLAHPEELADFKMEIIQEVGDHA